MTRPEPKPPPLVWDELLRRWVPRERRQPAHDLGALAGVLCDDDQREERR